MENTKAYEVVVKGGKGTLHTRALNVVDAAHVALVDIEDFTGELLTLDDIVSITEL